MVPAAATTGREADIARDLLPEIQSRLEFLEEVGLGYLTLDRGAPTLSAVARRSASAWRRSWAATCKACAMCWTNPPSACTRATTSILLNALHKLGDKGNTLVVVEHDEDTIRRADHVIDIGPSAGKRGGRAGGPGHAWPTSWPPPIRKPAATCCTPCATRCRRGVRCGAWQGAAAIQTEAASADADA